MAELITKKELSDRAGVTKGAMTRLFKMGGRLEDALVDGKVNADHPLVINYIEEKQASPWRDAEAPDRAAKPKPATKPRPSRLDKAVAKPDTPKAAPAEMQTVMPEADDGPDIEELQNMTLRQILDRWGTLPRFVSYLDAVKKMGEIHHRRTMTQERRGDLVDRTLAEITFLGVVEQAFKRLVTDIPEGLAVEVLARAQAGGPDARLDVLEIIRSANGRALKSAKDKVVENVRG